MNSFDEVPLSAFEFGRLLDAVGPFDASPCVAVATSGGADSVALCLLMHQWAEDRNGKCHALVVDHGLRSDSAREAVRAVVQDMVIPSDASIELVSAETDTIYYWMMAVAALLIYMILASLFESLGSPLIVFCTIPTAVVGSCWALIMTETGLTSQAGPMALLGFVVLLLVGRRLGRRSVALVGGVGTILPFLVAVELAVKLWSEGRAISVVSFEWVRVAELVVSFGLRFDGIAAGSTLVVTGVGSLVFLASIGRMAGDAGSHRALAHLYRDDGLWLQGEMLARGLARRRLAQLGRKPQGLESRPRVGVARASSSRLRRRR